MGEKENPPAAASAAAQTSSLLAAGPGALQQRFGVIPESEPCILEVGLGKAQDHWSLPLAWTEWEGGGELDGTQKGHTEGATLVIERRDCSKRSSLIQAFQPLIPCDMLWGMTGCGGRGELAVWKGKA